MQGTGHRQSVAKYRLVVWVASSAFMDLMVAHGETSSASKAINSGYTAWCCISISRCSTPQSPYLSRNYISVETASTMNKQQLVSTEVARSSGSLNEDAIPAPKKWAYRVLDRETWVSQIEALSISYWLSQISRLIDLQSRSFPSPSAIQHIVQTLGCKHWLQSGSHNWRLYLYRCYRWSAERGTA